MLKKPTHVGPRRFHGIGTSQGIVAKATEICKKHPFRPLALNPAAFASISVNGSGFPAIVGNIFANHNANLAM